MNTARIVFFGSSEFALPALDSLCSLPAYRPILVVTQPDKEKGRSLQHSPTPVGQYAEEHGLPLQKPDLPSDIADYICGQKPDLIISASYGALIGRSIRKAAGCGAINLHPSLLPLYRGAAPMQSAILNGDNVTGISIFRLNAKMDAGDILYQETHNIHSDEVYTTLHDRLAQRAADLLITKLPDILSAKIVPSPQNHAMATYCGKFNRQDWQINWDAEAFVVGNHIRAFSESPGAFTFYNGKQLKVLQCTATDLDSCDAPGSICGIEKNLGLRVNCRDKQILIKTVQAAGKKAMSAYSWLLGSRATIGQRFGI